MTRFRCALRVLASVWLCCQAAGLSVTTVALGLAPSSGFNALECTCARGDHAGCRMHHPTPSPESKSNCCCKGAADPAAAIVIAIVGPNAVVPRDIAFEMPTSVSPLTQESARHLPSIVLAPDGPPPRT